LFFSTPIVLFSTFRGQSGKDTELYIIRYNQDVFSFESFLRLDSEPFFSFISHLAKSLQLSYSGLFFIHSLFICVLYYLICKKWGEAKIFVLTVGPVVLVDGITNGMRITIAYHLFILLLLYRKKLLSYILPPLGHISILFATFFYEVFERIDKGLRFKQLLFLSSFIATVFIAIVNAEMLLSFSPRLLSKYHQYQSLNVSSSLSGLSDIFIVFSVLVLYSLFNSKSYFQLMINIFISLMIAVTLYGSVQLSIAFIRVLKLFMVSLLISPLIINNRKPSDYVFICLGFVYTANFMRQVLTNPGILPYGV
jgi:hypothetical protein